MEQTIIAIRFFEFFSR